MTTPHAEPCEQDALQMGVDVAAFGGSLSEEPGHAQPEHQLPSA